MCVILLFFTATTVILSMCMCMALNFYAFCYHESSKTSSYSPDDCKYIQYIAVLNLWLSKSHKITKRMSFSPAFQCSELNKSFLFFSQINSNGLLICECCASEMTPSANSEAIEKMRERETRVKRALNAIRTWMFVY